MVWQLLVREDYYFVDKKKSVLKSDTRPLTRPLDLVWWPSLFDRFELSYAIGRRHPDSKGWRFFMGR
jgi:hypothetical protein